MIIEEIELKGNLYPCKKWGGLPDCLLVMFTQALKGR